jgi:glycosyltransferase involved in cell wall biosynthesis
VHLAGWLAAEELRGLVARARASVLPSHYEGFGLPLLEAMAAGTRVLASDIAVHREVSNGHALLVPPTDVDGWAAALTAAGPLPEPARAAAADWATSHTWRRCAERTLEAYERAAA